MEQAMEHSRWKNQQNQGHWN